MTCREMMLVCGLAVTIGSTSALAQNKNQNDRDNEKGINSQLLSRTNEMDSVLDDLEGTWRVEVQVSPQFWASMQGNKDSSARYTPGQDRSNDQNKYDNDKNDKDKYDNDKINDKNKDDRSNPDRNNQDLNQRDSTPGYAEPGSSEQIANAQTLNGYARTQLILGGNVLEENFVILGTDWGKTKETREREDREGLSTPSEGAGQVQFLTFLSFDEASNTYSLVAMNDKCGKMHFDTGRYDASAKQIVFGGQGAGQHSMQPGTYDRMQDRDGGTQPGYDRDSNKDNNDRDNLNRDNQNQSPRTPTAQPQDRSQNWSDHASGMNPESMRVVLEILGPTSHRVTMYSMSGPAYGYENSARPGESTTRSTDAANRPGDSTTRQNESTTRQPGDRSTNSTGAYSQPGQGGTLVYQATYTRASGSDLTDSQKALRDSGSQTSVDDK